MPLFLKPKQCFECKEFKPKKNPYQTKGTCTYKNRRIDGKDDACPMGKYKSKEEIL